jgi:hypothetical protein
VYTVNRDSLFRHSAQDGHRVGPFIDLLAANGTETTPGPVGAENLCNQAIFVNHATGAVTPPDRN